MKKPSLLIVFLSVFIDLIGFGIVIPLLPLYIKDFGAAGWMIGAISASFSLMQFLFAPAWGRLSDRIGRRPVLLISNAGATVAYAMFAYASTMTGPAALWVLLASRIFAGIAGANLSVASAYIADISPPEKRSQSMGLIGMAFGFGFIVGPILGALSNKYLGLSGPGWVAASLCAVNFLFGYLVLKESLKPSSEQAAKRAPLDQWSFFLRKPTVGFLIVSYFFATFCFAAFEITFGIFIVRELGYKVEAIGYLLGYCGILAALIQGGAIGKLVKRVGEPKLISMSLFVTGAGLAILPYATTLPMVLIGLAVFAVGSGINRPPTFGLLSILTPASEQGAALGVAQSAGSLARIIAPPFATVLLDRHPHTPYLVCSLISIVVGIFAWKRLGRKVNPASVVQSA